MTLSGLNLVGVLRQRTRAVFGAFAASAACCVCGALLTFVLAPGQALQAFQVSRLPVMDAASVQAAAPGDMLLVTGVLAGNPPALAGLDLVAYRVDEWQITVTEDDDSGSDVTNGKWQSQGTVVPLLNLEVGGQAVVVQAAPNARLGGALEEVFAEGPGPLSDKDFDGRDLPEGTRRYKGLVDGGLTTVLGEKATAGGITPRQLYAGDRTAFEASERQAASGLFFAGLCAMALSPAVLVGGVLAALLGRRR